MRAKTAKQQLEEYCGQIKQEIERWKYINNQGCNDPFWPDGCNMNLVRNHIIFYKEKIKELCQENGLNLPPECYLATPPEVDNRYMATLKQEKRVERLNQTWGIVMGKKNKYDDYQLTLF